MKAIWIGLVVALTGCAGLESPDPASPYYAYSSGWVVQLNRPLTIEPVAGVAAVLSGHTHGGQVRIPGRPVIVRMSRYRLDEGLYRSGDCTLLVSRGLGVSGIPLRLWVSPEAARVTLRRVP